MVEVGGWEAFGALASTSGIMATIFPLAASVASRLREPGVAADTARACVGERKTRGGLNEQLRLRMAQEGALDAFGVSLQLLYRRIQTGG